MSDPGIIRNRLKIESAVTNARCYLDLQKNEGAFDTFLWSFVGGRPRKNAWKSIEEVPCESPESTAMSKALKSHGFRFVGPTICYAFMQAVGMVNDHTTDCYRYAEV
jgi:DNA-3-methyladenine glycosylase I